MSALMPNPALSVGSLPSSVRRNMMVDQRNSNNVPLKKEEKIIPTKGISPVFMTSKSKLTEKGETNSKEIKTSTKNEDTNTIINAAGSTSKSKQFLETILAKQKETKKSQEERELEVNAIRASIVARESIIEARSMKATNTTSSAPSTPRRASMWRLLTLQSKPLPVEQVSVSCKQRQEEKKAHFAKLGSVYATHAYANESVVQSPRNDEPVLMVDDSFTEGRRSSFEGEMKDELK